MKTLITLCRDIEEPTSTGCIEDREGVDVPLVAPCKVTRERCAPPDAEADSSATRYGEMVILDCCDC
jgi:hypothetical protein